MATQKNDKKQGRGRPRLNVTRRGITLTPEDLTFFKNYGLGQVSAGIRRAAAKLRGMKITE